MKTAASQQFVQDDDDRNTLSTVLTAVLPIAKKMFGEDSIHFHVLKESFREMAGDRKTEDGKITSGTRYHPEIMVFALTLLRDTDTKTYNSLREVLFLPEIRHTKRKLREILGDVKEGPCLDMMNQMVSAWSKWAAENPGKSKDWNQVNISFDQMSIAAGTMLITKKDELNRISGVILPENMDVARSIFDEFVFHLAEERGIGPSKKGKVEAISPLLTRNTDHSVYYVSSQNPYCDLCFIGAIYNTPTVNKGDIQEQMRRLVMALAERGLYPRTQVSDCAGSNVGHTNAVCKLSAKNFIPVHVL